MHYFIINLKNKLVYRWEAFFNMLTNMVYVFVNTCLWVFLYRMDQELVIYMIRYTVISNIISLFYLRNVARNIGKKIVDGSIIMDLLKPTNFFFMTWQTELAEMLSDVVLFGVPLIACFAYFLFVSPKYYAVITTLLAVLLGHIFYFLIYSFIGLMAFVFISIDYHVRLINDTIRLIAGSFIPIAILPGSLQTVARSLPFRYLFSFPLELLLNEKVTDISLNFIILISWIAFFTLLNFIAYRIVIRKIAVQGG